MTATIPFAEMSPTDQSKAVDDMARRIVGEDVRYCLSGLIHGLTRIVGELSGSQLRALGTDEDDLMTLAYMKPDADDYAQSDDVWLESPQHPRVPIYEIEEGDDGFRWTETAAIQLEGEPLEKGEWHETALDAWEELFEEQGFSTPDGSEIYEHWAVSSWLAGKLREHGHAVVDDVAGLTVWGRPTTGQMIQMDSVIQRIARDMLEAR